MCNPKNGVGAKKKREELARVPVYCACLSKNIIWRAGPFIHRKRLNGAASNPPNRHRNARRERQSALSIYNSLVERQVSTHKSRTGHL